MGGDVMLNIGGGQEKEAFLTPLISKEQVKYSLVIFTL
jgi:hypothetical protein